MVRVAFYFCNGSVPQSGQETAAHAAIGAIRFNPALDSIISNRFHALTKKLGYPTGCSKTSSAPNQLAAAYERRTGAVPQGSNPSLIEHPICPTTLLECLRLSRPVDEL